MIKKKAGKCIAAHSCFYYRMYNSPLVYSAFFSLFQALIFSYFAQGEMSNSSSSNSLNLVGGSLGAPGNSRTAVRSRQSSVTGSNEHLDNQPTPVSSPIDL